MKRYTQSLSLLALFLFVIASVAWYIEPTRRVDWIPMFALGVAVWTVHLNLKDMQTRLDKLEEPPKDS